MDLEKLRKHIEYFVKRQKTPEMVADYEERLERIRFYQSWTKDRILNMIEENLYEYLAKLWAMLIWGNKHYVVNKLIKDNGFEYIKKQLAEVIWGNDPIEKRWDHFQDGVKGMGPAMISEILCHVHPEKYIIWNRRALVGLDYLSVKNLPRYNYQLTGKRYKELSNIGKTIEKELKNSGLKDANLLSVDYFIWDELQVKKNLSRIFIKEEKIIEKELKKEKENQNLSIMKSAIN